MADHLHPSDPDMRVEIGREAQQIMEAPIVQAAFAKIERDYQTRWLSSEQGESVKREEAYLMLKALADFKRVLTTAMDTGRIIESKRTLEATQRSLVSEFDNRDGRCSI